MRIMVETPNRPFVNCEDGKYVVFVIRIKVNNE